MDTLQVYSHVADGMDGAAAERVAALFDPVISTRDQG
jgi:hypothetical protein